MLPDYVSIQDLLWSSGAAAVPGLEVGEAFHPLEDLRQHENRVRVD
jgi:hypothetical protein